MNNCINLTKIAILKNKKGFIIPKNKKNFNIIKAFLKLNIIKFTLIKNNNIISYINYINNKPIFKNIVNVFKPSKKNYLNINEIKKINKKHNWIILLSTNKGVLNSIEAANLNVGGLVLAILWN